MADKEFQERLKEDVHLKVSDSDAAQEISASTGDSQRSAGEAAPASNERLTSTTASLLDQHATLIDKATILAEKKEKEKAFLAAHRKRVVRSRMITCVALIGLYMSIQALFWYSFGSGPKIDFTYNKLIPMSLYGSIGERDFAYSLLSQITNVKTQDTPGLLNVRSKIIDGAISDMEKSGHPAILTRLSAEQTQMQFGDRKKGLAIGDKLIEAYPNLASNYLWRARVDFEQARFPDVIEAQDKAISLLKKDSPADAKAWVPELSKGYWAGLYSGQFDKSSQYINYIKTFGGTSADATTAAFKSMQLIASAEALAAPILRNTDLWSPALEHIYTASLQEAVKQAQKAPSWNEGEDELSFVSKWDLQRRANLALGKYTEYEKNLGNYEYELLPKAQLHIAQGKYAEALENANSYPYKYRSIEKSYYKANALLHLHRPKEAAAAADKAVDRFANWDMNTLLYLPLRLVKAHALADSHQFADAIKECDLILKINPMMIEAHAIKLQVYKEQGNSVAAKAEHKVLENALSSALADSERILKDE